MPPEVARARVRALLHDQGGRQGHRAWACRWSTAWRASRAAPRGSKARPARALRSSCCSARPTDVRDADPRPTDDPAAPEPAPSPLSVLVIDDDPDVRGFIVDALEEQGYRVRQAARRPRRHRRKSNARRPTWSSSTSSCPACRAPRSPAASAPKRPGPADPVRVRLQRDRGGQAHRARRAAARQAVPRRGAGQRRSGRDDPAG